MASVAQAMTNKHVFISYSSKDSSFVQALVTDLKKSGLVVWLDEARLIGGDSLLGEINNAIRGAAAFVVVLSSHSVHSRWVLKEIDFALSKDIATEGFRIIPVLLEPLEIPSLLLGKVQVDFSRSRDHRESIGKLLRALGMPPADEEEPKNYGIVFEQQLMAALDLLKTVKLCYVAPEIPEKLHNVIRESCHIPPNEKIYAAVARYGSIYTGTVLKFWSFRRQGEESLVFTQKGVYAAGYRRIRSFKWNLERKLATTYSELKEIEAVEFETEYMDDNGTHIEYHIGLGDFSMIMPRIARSQLASVIRLIQSL